jgi:Holliday junction DNA helicase RuvA
MISFVKGILAEVLEDTIVVENNGIGFEIRAAGSVFAALPHTGEEVKIYTYLYVREDEMSLFGFESRDELNVFRQLITVSGIGPKGALAILSTLNVNELRVAVMNEDAKSISASPGIGLKTAQKLIIELKGKLGEATDGGASILEALQTPDVTDARGEAVAALTALGYSNSEAVLAVKKVEFTPDMDAEAVLKASLKHLTFM